MMAAGARHDDDEEEGVGGLSIGKGKKGGGPMFSMRIVSLDYYMAPPLPDMDVCYSQFQGETNAFTNPLPARRNVKRSLVANSNPASFILARISLSLLLLAI
jgi:hypothetical protein